MTFEFRRRVSPDAKGIETIQQFVDARVTSGRRVSPDAKGIETFTS